MTDDEYEKAFFASLEAEFEPEAASLRAALEQERQDHKRIMAEWDQAAVERGCEIQSLKAALAAEKAALQAAEARADALQKTNDILRHEKAQAYEKRGRYEAERDEANARAKELEKAATRASAELRHATKGSSPSNSPAKNLRTYDSYLIDRAIVILEKAVSDDGKA